MLSNDVGGEITNIARWDYETHKYEPYHPKPSWKIVIYSENMDEPINCTSCGKDMTFGDGYTSREIHNSAGLGYPVCENCYKNEASRDDGKR